MLTKIKKQTSSVLNVAKEQYSKSFDIAKIQSLKVKDKVDSKIQERAILNLKAELALRHKTFDDYSDDEIEILLANEKRKIVDELKTKTLVGALALLGLDFLV